MNNTIQNLKSNLNICVVGGYFRVKGSVEIFSSGEYFDYAQKNNKDYKVKHAILITINEVFSLDLVKKIL